MEQEDMRTKGFDHGDGFTQGPWGIERTNLYEALIAAAAALHFFGHDEDADKARSILAKARGVDEGITETMQNLIYACEQRRVRDLDPDSPITVLETRTADIVDFHDALDAAIAAIADTHPKDGDVKQAPALLSGGGAVGNRTKGSRS